jgi:hypothetical protein
MLNPVAVERAAQTAAGEFTEEMGDLIFPQPDRTGRDI